jgi:hypothetical protein
MRAPPFDALFVRFHSDASAQAGCHMALLLIGLIGPVRAAFLSGADLTGVRWPDGVPVPEHRIVDSKSDRLKRADELSEVAAHYLW